MFKSNGGRSCLVSYKCQENSIKLPWWQYTITLIFCTFIFYNACVLIIWILFYNLSNSKSDHVVCNISILLTARCKLSRSLLKANCNDSTVATLSNVWSVWVNGSYLNSSLRFIFDAYCLQTEANSRISIIEYLLVSIF